MESEIRKTVTWFLDEPLAKIVCTVGSMKAKIV